MKFITVTVLLSICLASCLWAQGAQVDDPESLLIKELISENKKVVESMHNLPHLLERCERSRGTLGTEEHQLFIRKLVFDNKEVVESLYHLADILDNCKLSKKELKKEVGGLQIADWALSVGFGSSLMGVMTQTKLTPAQVAAGGAVTTFLSRLLIWKGGNNGRKFVGVMTIVNGVTMVVKF